MRCCDAHAHLDPRLKRLLDPDHHVMISCTSREEHAHARSLFSPSVRISCGVHPWNADQISVDELIPCMKEADFIGEIGMDSVWCDVPHDVQRSVFRRQLRLAKEWRKPVILHTKGMEHEILQEIQACPNDYVVHWYSCAHDMEEYIALGCAFTFALSLESDEHERRLAAMVPLEHILVESDGISAMEWVKGRPIRDAEYEAGLRQIEALLAEIRGLSPEAMHEQICANYRRIILR